VRPIDGDGDGVVHGDIEVLTTPGALFLGSGGGIREQPPVAKASRRVASLATPDLRVMSADGEVGVFSMF
jgi:hypothetical protein